VARPPDILSALSTDGVCTPENWDQYVMTFESNTEADATRAYHSVSAWAEPTDQLTMEDRHASWNHCVGQFATFTTFSVSWNVQGKAKVR